MLHGHAFGTLSGDRSGGDHRDHKTDKKSGDDPLGKFAVDLGSKSVAPHLSPLSLFGVSAHPCSFRHAEVRSKAAKDLRVAVELDLRDMNSESSAKARARPLL